MNKHGLKEYFPSDDITTRSGRIIFIDLMRAYAILMMIQGHVVDAFIDPIYRDSGNWIFSLWDHMRGVTAPVFFFSAGAIFSYLLLRKDLPLKDNTRFHKGIRRVFILLFVGYLLRFNPRLLLNLRDFDFHTYKSSFAVDALHCIAIGLGLIILNYILSKITRTPVWIYYFCFALVMFHLYPAATEIRWAEIMPLPLANYFTKEYGSNFPIIPWTGFVMWGALLGYILSKKVHLAASNIFAITMLLLGVLLHYESGIMLNFIFQITKIKSFYYLSQNNYLYYHLGSIFIVLGILALMANFMKIPSIILAVGKNTMMIYILHVFVIYGTGYNVGLYQYFGKSLGPYQVVIAAILMLLFFIAIVYFREKMEPIIRKKYLEYFPGKSS